MALKREAIMICLQLRVKMYSDAVFHYVEVSAMLSYIFTLYNAAFFNTKPRRGPLTKLRSYYFYYTDETFLCRILRYSFVIQKGQLKSIL